MTLSGNPASFLDGGEQAVPVPAGLGQVGVQFEEFGTRLNFLPIVLGNGRIHLEVEPEVSSLNAAAGVVIAGATVPGRQTQRVHTTVELESGQTFVIGGLIQHTSTGTTNKVPVLGQLPFLGTFFSTKTYSEEETELVVLVTPHLVDAQSCDQLTKVLPGQETRSPDDFELFLEGILEAPRGTAGHLPGNPVCSEPSKSARRRTCSRVLDRATGFTVGRSGREAARQGAAQRGAARATAACRLTATPVAPGPGPLQRPRWRECPAGRRSAGCRGCSGAAAEIPNPAGRDAGHAGKAAGVGTGPAGRGPVGDDAGQRSNEAARMASGGRGAAALLRIGAVS